MTLRFSSEIISVFDLIRSELESDRALYLVGGAVRDALLGRQLHDLDFTMAGNPKGLAKRLANRLNAGYFVLDDVRHTARVVYHTSDGDLFPLDFVQFTGENLMDDLKNRDFTINAMGVAMDNMTVVIDPLGGQLDLNKRIIRNCTRQSLLDDPVRVLRGIRLAMQFSFEYAPGLDVLMRQAAVHLPETSYERQRDEFFRILEGPRPSMGIEHCRQYRVFETLIPALIAQDKIQASPMHVSPRLDHRFSLVDRYNLLLQVLHPEGVTLEEAPWWLSQALSNLGHFSTEIRAFFEEEITPGRTKRGLALLGALLHNVDKTTTIKAYDNGYSPVNDHEILAADLAWDTAKRLQLSNAESEWVRTMVGCNRCLSPWVDSDQPPSRRTVYQFFNEVGEVGVPIALLLLAKFLTTSDERLSPPVWDKALKVSKTILSAWWEQRDTVVSPQLFLDGNDLQADFGLQPGKQLGQLLDNLAEAQASGEVHTQDEARAFIWKQLTD
jgi:tRNA nucleotidyltransferase/poly(A) polymerase